MILEQLQEDLKNAMRAQDKLRMETLRGMISELKRWKVDHPGESYTDEVEATTLRRQVKQRKESIDQFVKGNRPELADKERAEMAIIESYLPQLLSAEQVLEIAVAKAAALGVSDKSGTGKLMGELMRELKGKADGGVVKQVVEQVLGG